MFTKYKKSVSNVTRKILYISKVTSWLSHPTAAWEKLPLKKKRYVHIFLGILAAAGLFFLLWILLSPKRVVIDDPTFAKEEEDPLVSWVGYTDTEHGFSVSLPKDPLVNTKTTENLTYKEIAVENYFVRVFPAKGKNINQMDAQVKNIVKEAGRGAGIVYADHFADANKTPFLDFKIVNKTDVFKGRMFLVNDKIYILLNVSPMKKEIVVGFAAFLSSFTLTQ